MGTAIAGSAARASATTRVTTAGGESGRNSISRKNASTASGKSARSPPKKSAHTAGGRSHSTSFSVSTGTSSTTRLPSTRAACTVIAPDIEWPTSTTRGRSSARTTAATSSAKCSTVQSLRAHPELPCPARSTATTRCVGANRVIASFHQPALPSQPCTNTSAMPPLPPSR